MSNKSLYSINAYFNEYPEIGIDFVSDDKLFLAIQDLEAGTVIPINNNQRGRLDLISYEQYGITELWWILAIRNKIINPFNWENVYLDIPLQSDINQLLLDRKIDKNRII